MRRTFISIILAASAMVAVCSCQDYLVEDPKGKQNPANFFSSPDDISLAMNALYSLVQETQASASPQACQWGGDDITTHPASNKSEFREFDRLAPSNNNSRLNDAWNMHYNLIKETNEIINNVKKAPVDTTIVNMALGNAKFWRAYAYFYLVRLFGPLPLNVTNEQDNYTSSLTSVPDIYNLIVKDLNDAVMLLPEHYEDAPAYLNEVDVYATENAAEAMLSAVYMAMAGFPMNKTEYYAKAAAEAKKVIDANYFVMDTDWSNVYSIANNNNREIVLGINNSPVLGSWTHTSQQSSSCIIESSGFGGWNDAMGELQFWLDFPEGIRKNYVYEPQILRQSDKKLYYWWEKNDTVPVFPEYHPALCVFTHNGERGTLYYQKFDYTQTKYEGETCDLRHRLIRISEVMLWYAESAARSGASDLSFAREYLKQVHNRACDRKDTVNGIAIDAMTPDQLAKACYDEHGWEIAGNWKALVTRRFDQLRMNSLRDNFERRKINEPIHIPGTSYTARETVLINDGDVWDDMKNYLPYPDNDSKKNPNLKRKSLLE